jgi:two-component system response regulator DesR
MTGVLRVLLAEDVDLVAEAFVALLNTEPGIEVVARVGRGDQVLEVARERRPDVALLDIDMPGTSGITAAAQLRQELPSCKAILLTSLEGVGHVHRAIEAGAAGYVLKSTTAAALVASIRAAHEGRVVVDPALATAALRQGPSPLTSREAEILGLAGAGVSTKDIAAKFFLSEGTVRNNLSKAMTKLDARTRAEAYATAKRLGWL